MTRRQIDLPEDTWRKLKAHAAIRGQTLSGLFGDMASDALSDRRSVAAREMTPKEKREMTRAVVPDPSTDISTTASVERFDVPARGRPRNVTPGPGTSFGHSRPAPKTTRAKKP